MSLYVNRLRKPYRSDCVRVWVTLVKGTVLPTLNNSEPVLLKPLKFFIDLISLPGKFTSDPLSVNFTWRVNYVLAILRYSYLFILFSSSSALNVTSRLAEALQKVRKSRKEQTISPPFRHKVYHEKPRDTKLS